MKSMTCYYCGEPIDPSLHGKPKKRKEQGTWWRVLHATCATKWDSEGKRL